MSVVITPEALEIRLSPLQKVGAARGDLSFPLASITQVEVLTDGIAAVRGVRAPGLGLPGARMLGTWRGRFGKEFVDVRRGEGAVRVTLAGQGYDFLLLGAADPAALARQISGNG
jgi:hypothetical protein